jgi:hypothetical protein
LFDKLLISSKEIFKPLKLNCSGVTGAITIFEAKVAAATD